jgi:hypothetical protein
VVAAIGQRSPQSGPWCMPIVGGFVARGRRLMRQRGERIERSFAHLYDTGGMRRTHLRGHTNILKRLLIHAGGFNLGLVMRHLIGSGTPRGESLLLERRGNPTGHSLLMMPVAAAIIRPVSTQPTSAKQINREFRTYKAFARTSPVQQTLSVQSPLRACWLMRGGQWPAEPVARERLRSRKPGAKSAAVSASIRYISL